MSDFKYRQQIELLSAADGVRRRHWSDEDKLRIVEENLVGHRQAAATARRHGICLSLLTTWRRQYRNGELGVSRPVSFAPVTVTTGASAPQANPVAVAVQQVLAGRAFYGRGDPLSLVKAVAEGAEVVAFATPLHTSPMIVYSSPDDPIYNPQDMEGKTMGIAAPGAASDNILDMMLASVGLPPDSVRREAIGNSPGGWGLIQQGRVDAHIVSIGTTC